MKQSKVKEYFRPESVAEALRILSGYPGAIRVIAGGTDLFTADHLDMEALLDVDKLGLAYVREEAGTLHIGAATTFAEIAKSPLIREKFTALQEAARQLADRSTRNMATIGGNVCTALPSGDAIAPLAAAGARFLTATPAGEKRYGVEDFFLGPRRTVLEKGDILTEIQIPACGAGEATAFEKMGRNSEDLAIVNVAVKVRVNADGSVAAAAVAHGAVAPTVVRSTALEQALAGKKLCEDCLDEYCQLVDQAIAPIDNIRATAAYRRECSRVLTKRALLRAYEAAGRRA